MRTWAVVVLDVAVDTSKPAGSLVVDVVAAAAQFESRRIGERVRTVHAVRKAQGLRAVSDRSRSENTFTSVPLQATQSCRLTFESRRVSITI